jgi:hypothetical protein
MPSIDGGFNLTMCIPRKSLSSKYSSETVTTLEKAQEMFAGDQNMVAFMLATFQHTVVA